MSQHNLNDKEGLCMHLLVYLYPEQGGAFVAAGPLTSFICTLKPPGPTSLEASDWQRSVDCVSNTEAERIKSVCFLLYNSSCTGPYFLATTCTTRKGSFWTEGSSVFGLLQNPTLDSGSMKAMSSHVRLPPVSLYRSRDVRRLCAVSALDSSPARVDESADWKQPMLWRCSARAGLPQRPLPPSPTYAHLVLGQTRMQTCLYLLQGLASATSPAQRTPPRNGGARGRPARRRAKCALPPARETSSPWTRPPPVRGPSCVPASTVSRLRSGSAAIVEATRGGL